MLCRRYNIFHCQPNEKIARFLQERNNSTTYSAKNEPTPKLPYRVAPYEQLFQESVEYPEEFWAEQAERLVWFKKWRKVLDNSNSPFTKWFVGGELNTCYNALDRHVESGSGDKLALIYDSPITGVKKSYTYAELLHLTSLFAGVLVNHGVKKHDRVLIYMPCIPEAIVAMLACSRIGAIHSVVFGGFAAKELSVRINHCEPKVIVSASAGAEPNRIVNYKPMLDEAIEMSTSKPSSCIIYQRRNLSVSSMVKFRDFDWDLEMERAKPEPCASVSATDPLYVLYTSGTTGLPKGVVRPSGGHAVVLPWSLQIVYGIKPNECWWAASDLGWVVGHSFICYGPLIYGLTSILYEGKPVGTPDSGQYFRVISEHNVVSMFCAPTALRAIRQADHEAVEGSKYNMDKFRILFSAGEHLDHETRYWGQKTFKVPVLDHWWQTESGWPISANAVGCSNTLLDQPKDASGKPVPGWNVKVLKENSNVEAEPNELGRIVVKLPLPPGTLSTFWKGDDRFASTYYQTFPNHYDTMDAGTRTEDNFISVMSRADDVINVAGHRLSGGALEEAILGHSEVVDCAVVGVADQLKGDVPVALCVLRSDFHGSAETIQQEVVELVRKEIGPVAALRKVVVIPKLPKTRSGKIARNTIAAMANDKPYMIPVTIEDPTVYPQIRVALKSIGLGLHGADPEF